MRRKHLVPLLLFLAASAGTRADSIDDYITSQMKTFHLPGLSLAVIKNGEVIKAQGYGFADVEKQVAATPETVYKIGSVSKQFIATGVMLLVQEGRLGLDDPITKYLIEAPSTWQPVTVRHALAHTSGFVRECPGFDPLKAQSDADLLETAYPVPLRFTPGARWEYSNVGYYALAEVIRRVSGGPWSDYLQEKVFVPSGMNATFPTNTTRTLATLAVGYTGDDNQRRANHWVALRPSGAFLSTVLDLAKWDAMLYTDRILSETTRRLMWTPVRLTDGTPAPYGFGWHVHAGKGPTRVWHGGGMPGFAAHFARFADDRLSVIALANGDDVDLFSVVSGVARLYREAPEPAAIPR
jgi:D-alanyl-D-alanine carboxypeptidase